jgi:hypothetical protein
VHPSQQTSPPPVTGDPVNIVMSKLPSGKGDIASFLVSYGITYIATYIAVDALAASIGLPPPITTAALASGVVVGVRNGIQAYLERSQGPQSKRALKKRTEAFEKMLRGDDTSSARQIQARLDSAQRFREIESDEDYKTTLDKLIAEYKNSAAVTAIPAGER